MKKSLSFAHKTPTARESWLAMLKFADDKPLSPREWLALSWLTLINKRHRVFGPGNVRWATSDAERAANEKFYRSL